jgi:2-methylcitrate dehydratase PrpD
MHSIVDAVAQFKNQYKVESKEIDEIQVGGSEKLVAYSGIYEINSAMAAQYSAPFCVAMTLLGDIQNPANFKKVSGGMKEFKEVMMKTKLYKDNELEELSPSTEGAKVSFKLKSGKTVDTQVMHARGNPNNPMSFDDTRAKFAVVTGDRIDVKKRDQIIDLTQNLESLPNIAKLTKLFA